METSKSSVTPDSAIITTTYNTMVHQAITEQASKADTHQAHQYPGMLPGNEGQIYDDGTRKYIFLSNNYWPVEFIDEYSYVIPALNDESLYIQIAVPDTAPAPKPVTPQRQQQTQPDAAPRPVSASPTQANNEIKKPVPFAQDRLPVLPGVTYTSLALEKRVSALFPATSGYKGKVTDLKLLIPNQRIYYGFGKHFLYVGGGYYYLTDLEVDATGVIVGNIHSTPNPRGSEARTLSIYYDNNKKQWELKQEQTESESADESKFFTMLSYSVQSVLDSIKTGAGFTYNNMASGAEGVVYTSGKDRYIYLMGKYWPAKFQSDKQVEVTIKTADEKADVVLNLELQNNELRFSSGRGSDNNIIQSSVSHIVTRLIKEADESSKFNHPKVQAGVQGFVYKNGSDNYMFIDGSFYSFQWISDNFAAIKFTVSDKTHLLFIKRDQQQWHFVEDAVSDDYENFADTLRIIKRIDVDPDTHKKFQKILLQAENQSWQITSIKLHKIIEDEIFKRYANPDDKYLKDLLMARSRVDAWIDEDNRKSLMNDEREWSEALSLIYRDALSRGVSNPAILGAAQEAKAQIKVLEQKRDALKINTINDRLKTVEKNISDYDFEILTRNAMLAQNEYSVSDKIFLENALNKYYKKLEIAKNVQKTLNELNDKIAGQIKEYDQQIKTLKSTYKIAFAGIALGEKTLKTNLLQQSGKENEIIATEAAIVELALKEVALVSKDRSKYTVEEIAELEKIRVAKSLLMFRQDQASKYSEVIDKLTDDDIEKPDLKGNYSDIIWAEQLGEKLARKLFINDEDSALEDIVSAICYWLLKKKAKVVDLQSVDVNKVLDFYYTEAHSLNPLNQHKAMPAGFTPLSGLLANKYFENQQDYNKQFSEYKKNFAEYEASEVTQDLLAASQLSVQELQQPIKKRVRLRITTGRSKDKSYSGEMVFIQLDDGRWVFFSLFPKRLFSRIFTEQEVANNVYLSRLTNISDVEGNNRTGMIDMFPMDFFHAYDFPGNQLYPTYDSAAVRWFQIQTKVMENILYPGSGDDADSPPFSRDKPGLDIHRVVFKYSDNEDIEDDTNIIDVINESMTAVLGYSADEKKADLYKPSLIQKVANFIVPFYSEIYKAVTDPEHTVDEKSILLDTLSVVTAVSMAGVRVAAIIKNTKGIVQLTRTGLKNGLSGQPLRMFVAKELAKRPDFKALQISKVAASTTVDILDPFMLKEVAKFALKRGAKSARQLVTLAPGGAKLAYNLRITNRHKMKDINLEQMEKEVVHGNEVFSTLDSKTKTKKYYVKTNEDEIFQVRWDDAEATWRTVDPKYPNKLSYGQAIEFSNGEWKVNYLNASDKNMFSRFTPKEPMRDAARRSQLAPDTSGVCWDYAVDLVENAKFLTPEKATELRKGIKLASRHQSGDPDAPGGIAKLFDSINAINNEEALLRIKPGQVIVFMATDPNSPAKGARPIHAMVSIGNGRFAGMKNSVLHRSLSDEKKILTAEQLGEFKEGAFRLRGADQNLTDLHILAGEPKGMMRKEVPSLQTLAELSVPGPKVDTINEVTRILKASGELDWRQANALAEELRALFRPKQGTVIATNHSVSKLFNSSVDISSRGGLDAVKKGQLVVITEPQSSFSIQHFMIGLGNGEFMMINPHLLDASLAGSSGIVKASQFSDEIFSKFRLKSGDLSLGNLRMTSLLGRESDFRAIGSELIVRMHGAPMMAHGMDAYELSEAIRGLALRNKIDLNTIKDINFESCFGAFGTVSNGKALAHLMNKKVTAYPLVFNNMMRRNTSFFQRARTYLPGDLGPAELAKVIRQNSRNHNLWTHLYTPALVIGGYRSPKDFMDVLDNVKLLAQGEMTAAKFLENTPEFKLNLYISEKELTELVSSSVARGTDDFAQRCWDILMASSYSASLVDKALGGTGD